ncbi:MAG: DivIVA domain-containing protein [Bacteroidetes bacterium]|nr:DivIVA domain-containing protein [Bacteroidota bacterium]
MKTKLTYYLTPALLAILMFLSNFLSADLFDVGFQNFSVWFILSLFAFVCGWLINKTLGWKFGGKVVFSVIIGAAAIGMGLIMFFNKYFGVNEVVTENLILYSLRNIMLGSMAFFGMSVAELTLLQKELAVCKKTEKKEPNLKENSEKEAFLILNKAKLDADKMLFEAEKQRNEIITNKNRIETQLREFIKVERELIKKYEQESEYK